MKFQKIFLNDNSLEDKKIEAARYCKNDLCSEIVYEFPELQGIMGGKYLKNEGFSEEICLAVAEHYLPAFIKMLCPRYGAIVSISDKIETLISIFISGKSIIRSLCFKKKFEWSDNLGL